MADFGIYSAASNAIAGNALSAQNLLSIENPTASTNNVLITDVDLAVIQSALTTTAISYHLGRTTGLPSGGTILSSQKRDSSSPNAVAVVRTLATATAAAGQFWSVAPPLVMGLTLSGTSPFFVTKAFGAKNEADSIILAPGEALLMSVDANLATYSHTVTVSWRETTR